ncbi:putative pre-tape measure chaperone protein [Caudoviricetes sp.]|nr:putative pre-tape measure chaperone protein [Caudoviricetes sp.]UOF82723.1 putative pre-tape measure chaperone protein [Caudoviricetes sp.]
MTLKKIGRSVKALDEKPEIDEENSWINAGFITLSRSREWGVAGPLPLKLSEMIAWLDLHEIMDGDSRREFCMAIQQLDNVWFENRTKKQDDTKDSRRRS